MTKRWPTSVSCSITPWRAWMTSAGDEDGVGHRLSSIAAATRSACTVSATSWVRMISAPPLRRNQMRRDRAAEPLLRLRGRDRADEALARGADQQRQAERAQVRRAAPAPSCSAPASCRSRCRDRARYFRVRMPALAAISSERAKKAAISFMMSMAASARSRLCMTMTGDVARGEQLCHVGIALQAPDVVGDGGAVRRAPRRRRPISCCRSRRERRARPRRPGPAAAAAVLRPPRPARAP